MERDGKRVSPRTFDEFHILPDVSDAIQKLKTEGYLVVVVSNQPDIARKLMETQELDQMSAQLQTLGVDAIRICPHDGSDECLCRKPKPGLLTSFLDSLVPGPTEIWMVGDSESDIVAGIAVNARTILLTESSPSPGSRAEFSRLTLSEAVEVICHGDPPIWE